MRDRPPSCRRQAAFEKRQRARPKSAAPRLSAQKSEEAAAAEDGRPGQKLKKYLENDGKVLRSVARNPKSMVMSEKRRGIERKTLIHVLMMLMCSTESES